MAGDHTAAAVPRQDHVGMRRRTLIAGTLALAGSTARGATPLRSESPAAIKLVESELATAVNMRTGANYGPTEAGPRRNIQQAVVEARDGDLIQISPGAIWAPGLGDGSTYLEAGMLHVWKSLTISNFPGKGRWRLAPSSIAYVDGWSGLVIREPNNSYSNSGDTLRSDPRKTIVIQGFDFDNWGRKGGNFGVRIRVNSGSGTWDHAHASVTLRDFRVGKRPYFESSSGVGGAAEDLQIEDGHVYDTGNAIGAGEGQDHNFYVAARRLTLRGVRGSRTRASAMVPMDGHILKCAAVHTMIEGCVFDCGPLGDNSYNIQCRAGGNVTIRGCLIIGGAKTQNRSTGVIGYENEITQTPWFYGAEGHSLLIEKNVIISHFDKPLVYFRPPGHDWQVRGVSSVVIRDNIGMCAQTSSWIPRFKDPVWIRDDPTGGPPWKANNTAMAYREDESGFTGRHHLIYRRTEGPIRGSGTVSTYRFVWPQGHMPRVDDLRGLG